MGEIVEVSVRFILCDHVLNSHDQCVLLCSDITRNLKFDADPSWVLKGYTVKNNPNSPNHYPFILRISFTVFALFTYTYHIHIMLRDPPVLINEKKRCAIITTTTILLKSKEMH